MKPFKTKQDALSEHVRQTTLKKYPGGLLNTDTVDGITVVSQEWHPDHAPTMEAVLQRKSLLPTPKQVERRQVAEMIRARLKR
jgi:hypothetical protein